MLTVKLEPVSAGQAAISNPAQGAVFESVGLPKPKLVRLAPGEDYEERATIRLTPALSEVQKPIWGTYRLSITYKAQYSNAEEIQRNLKVTVWQGEVSSDAIEVQLQPPGPESRGQVSGTVNTPDSVSNSRCHSFVNRSCRTPHGPDDERPRGPVFVLQPSTRPLLDYGAPRRRHGGYDTIPARAAHAL